VRENGRRQEFKSRVSFNPFLTVCKIHKTCNFNCLSFYNPCLHTLVDCLVYVLRSGLVVFKIKLLFHVMISEESLSSCVLFYVLFPKQKQKKQKNHDSMSVTDLSKTYSINIFFLIIQKVVL
jgi:hypothetical protein